MQDAAQQSSDTKQICNIPLCGRPANWEVDMFGKAEYYCERHRPGIPEKFMSKLSKD